MIEAGPTTTTTLLLDGLLNAADHAAWLEFQTRCVPIMLAFAQRLGLSEADAADVTQDALVRFVAEYREGRYDRGRGRLRAWLVAIVRYRVADLKRDEARRPPLAAPSAAAGVAAADELETLWVAEQRRVILQRAFEQLRERSRLAEKTIRAFERLVFDQRTADEVAGELGMTTGEVYVAKSRVSERLREIVRELEAAYEDG